MIRKVKVIRKMVEQTLWMRRMIMMVRRVMMIRKIREQRI